MLSPLSAASPKAPLTGSPKKSSLNTLQGVLGADSGERNLPQVPHLPCHMGPVTIAFSPEEGLSGEFFKHYCEAEDLSEVSRLEIQVDSAAQNIESIGQHLVNLQQLKLQTSSVLSLRDFGTELRSLQVLWMSRCGLQDLGGAASCLPVLREFYLPFNYVTDLSPLNGHEALEVLDIEGNGVADREEVEVLMTCPHLRELTLSGNPVLRNVERKDILCMMPGLEVLDDAETDMEEAPGSTRAPTFAEPDPEFDLKLMLSDVGVASGAASPFRGAHARTADEDFEAEASGSDSCSIESIPEVTRPRPKAEAADMNGDVRPLESRHPLLAEGLLKSAAQAKVSNPYAGEPDEDELVMDRLKQPRPVPHGFTDRAFSTGFSFGIADRRQAATEPSTFRPATSAGASAGAPWSDDWVRANGTSSSLTRGENALAGGPLDLLRHRRNDDSAGLLSGKAQVDIRELMRRYQTYTQPTKKVVHSREVPQSQGRLSTPDVRIRVVSKELSSAAGRPASSSGGRPASSGGRPTSSGGRPASAAGTEGPFGSVPAASPQSKGKGKPPPLDRSSGIDKLVLDPVSPASRSGGRLRRSGSGAQ